MTRSTAREIAMHLSYEMGFTDQNADELLARRFDPDYYKALSEDCPLYGERTNRKQKDYIFCVIKGIYTHWAELDSYIERYAVGWEFSRISRISSAIMRLAMYEILYMPDVPNGAAINEAVALSKNYDDEDAPAFINGILGSFVRQEAAE